MKTILSLTLFALFAAAIPDGQATLKQKLEVLTENFNGDVGIYVRHLKTGETVNINADTLFPTASMVKVPILIKIFELLDGDRLNYGGKLEWHADSINYPYDGQILWAFQEGKPITLDVLVWLMMSYSDNHASLWLQKIATGKGINTWLDSHGFHKTRVNSRTEGRQDDWRKYGWGQTTPREMAGLLVMIRDGKAVSPAASEEMYRVLSRNYYDDDALSMLPPTVQAASKNGAVNESRSEAVLVNAPGGDYVFSVITKNQQDTSWEYDNEGYMLLRTVSRMLWEHFESQNEWVPAVSSRKYQE